MRRALVLFPWLLRVVAACQPKIVPCPAPSVAQAIVAGASDERFLGLDDAGRAAIVLFEGTLEGEPARCSGVLVGDGWIATAAHCEPLLDATTERRRHPTLDLMLVRERSLGAGALPWADTLPELGALVEQAGFGGGRQPSAPSLLFNVAQVTRVTADTITVEGIGESGACGGDSGGPLLARLASGGVGVLGWLANGSQSCTGSDRYVSAAVADAWLRANVGPPSDEARCGAIDASGRCYGERAVYCRDGLAVSEACATCGFDVATGGYRCVTTDPCGGVSDLGECRGDDATWCEGGVLVSTACASCGSKCLRSNATGAVVCAQ